MKSCKKVVAILLTLVFMTSMFAGCGGNEETKSSSTEAKKTTASEMKPVKYKVMLNQAIAEYPPDGGSAKQEILKKLETDLGIKNVDYEVILVGGSDYDTKLNAMLAGGDVPDYFEISIDTLQSLVDNKVIAPIDTMIEKMPNYKKIMADDIITKASSENFSVDGKTYGIPYPSKMPVYNTSNGNMDGMVVRTDWLEKLKLKTPTTLSEFHDVLVAFKDNDPDGNGQKDTFGLSGDSGNMFKSIFGAYGIYLNGINSWTKVDGKLVHSTVLPQTKSVLETLQNWYKEGLIDPDKFVIEGKQAKSKFISGKFGAWEQSVWWVNDARIAWKDDKGKSAAIIDPLKGPEGKSGIPVPHIRTKARVVSKNCIENKDINLFASILDWMIDDSEKGGLKLIQYGVEGKHYKYDKTKDFIDQSLITDYVDLYKEGYSNPVRWLGVFDLRWISSEDPRTKDIAITSNESTWLKSEFLGSVPAMKDYPDLYNKLWSEYFTKIITGSLPIKAFDDYVEKFEKQGGKELTEQVNKAWAAKK